MVPNPLQDAPELDAAVPAVAETVNDGSVETNWLLPNQRLKLCGSLLLS